MEMRLLTTEGERHVFAQRLAEARSQHGASFRDVGRSQARNVVRLAAADLYGLFETERDDVENMTAGVALHDLALGIHPAIGVGMQRSLVTIARRRHACVARNRGSGRSQEP